MLACYLYKYDEREGIVDYSQTALCRREQKVRAENCSRPNVPKPINLTSLDLEGVFLSWIPGAYNFISRGYFQILFRASAKNFLLNPFKEIKSYTSKLIQQYKHFYSLLYANTGDKFPLKPAYEYDIFCTDQMQ